VATHTIHIDTIGLDTQTDAVNTVEATTQPPPYVTEEKQWRKGGNGGKVSPERPPPSQRISQLI
jgi:hypothetical protein